MGWWSTPRPHCFTTEKENQSHRAGVWVGHRTGLNGCRKSRHQKIPSRPQRVAIPSELSRPMSNSGVQVEGVIKVQTNWPFYVGEETPEDHFPWGKAAGV